MKFLGDGTVDCFKARLVARGFLQCKGVDYKQTYASVVRMTNIHVLMVVVAHEGLTVTNGR